MENIFNVITIPNNYFFNVNLEWDLLKYLNDNLKHENNIILTWELYTALTINANGKYI
jgi:hypothetical protein